MVQFLSTLLLFFAIVFLTYVLMILIPFVRYPKVKQGDPKDFQFHFLIPCRDEAAVIGTTIERALGTFPNAHLWIIDDDSDDDTANIVKGYLCRSPHVHLVQRRLPNARTGKGDALNAAFAELQTWLPNGIDHRKVIVTVVDADGELASNALDVVSSPSIFGDDHVGAAQIAVWMKNRYDKTPYPSRGRLANWMGSWLVRMQDMEFRTVIAGMQSLRAATGTVGLGGNGQFTRLSVLESIAENYGEPWHGALLEDYELGLHVLLSWSQIKHVYDTHVSQEALPSLRRLLTQRTRWAQGNIQCSSYIPEIIRSPKFDAAGVVETCYYLVLPYLQMIGGATLIFLFAHQAYLLAQNPMSEIDTRTVAWMIPLIIIFSICPFALWGPVYKLKAEPKISWVQSVFMGIGMWIYVYYMYVCIARAFIRIIRRKTGWSKTRRNADATGVQNGSVAIEA
ncbi:glycosyltransferase family 2 protein [Kocuria massiliensis]|uniref:glycosyltransferase family 2 protein n=1 Tax=Kocuria massiliensis TaxID=1926282 RepID=UPI0022B98488|nr:glycosyltransferase family 2 protein [Kocuria massiliensis]